MRNRKGERCLYDNTVFCQEGYCEDCEIYLQRWKGKMVKMPLKDALEIVKAHQTRVYTKLKGFE